MGRSEAMTKLRQRAQAIRAMGATSLYIFGSTVRDEGQTARDLDLFIDYDPATRFNAFDLVGIKQYLEDELELSIDVTTRDGLHPMLREEIEQTAVRVF
jgi:predicted nucleotidyltransferase